MNNIEFNNLNGKKWEPTIAIGGGHYCLNFNQIQLTSNYAISHVIPDYSFPITEQIIKEAEEKTKEQIDEVLIDWKSMKSVEREKLLEVLNRLKLKYIKTRNIKK